jgi:hypothetical protein
MTGWNTIQEIRRLEVEIDKLGFKFAKPTHTDWTSDHGAVALVPKELDSLPPYARDAVIYFGSLEGIQHWLKGLQWARDYDAMLKLSDDTKRSRKEQDWRNRNIVNIIKGEKA